MRRKTSSGPFTVSGPGCDVEGLPSVGTGISRALTAAERSTEDGSWYVREDGAGRFIVSRHGKLTFVTPANGTEPPPVERPARTMADVRAL